MTLRVLALHGFGQNASVFIEKRVKEICRKLKSSVLLHAIDAPYVLPYDPSLRAWFTYPPEVWDGRADSIQALAAEFLKVDEIDVIGFREAVDFIVAAWKSDKYDGIFAFSQGAVIATAVCSELIQQKCTLPRFMVLISGYGKPVPRGVLSYPPKEPMPVASLHIWGSSDDHIPPWTSEQLSKCFANPQMFVHSGAHFVPQKAADITALQNFIAPFLASQSKASPKILAPRNDRIGLDEKKQRVENPIGSHTSRAIDSGLGAFCHDFTLDELSMAIELYTSSMNHCDRDSREKMHPRGVTDYSPEEREPPGVDTYERLLGLLHRGRIDFLALGPHAACRKSEDSVQVRLAGGWKDVTLHSGAKAMLLRTACKSWLLCVVPADCKLSWKKVRALHGKATRMASEDEVRQTTGCMPGAVPPFAVAFPTSVDCLIDPSLPDVINFNCGLRSRSIQMSRLDYEYIQRPEIADIIE